MEIKKDKTLAEAIQETVTPDVMATIESTEKHKEEADKANAEAQKATDEFVKGEEKYAKKSADNSKKLKLSEDLDEAVEDEYVNVFGEVYGDLVNQFPNARTRSGFNKEETEGFVKIILPDDADKEIAKSIADKNGCEFSSTDRVVTIVAPTRRKKSDSVTVHDLYDEIHAQLTADGDKYDIWGKFSDNKGAGYGYSGQVGHEGHDFDKNTITVTVDPKREGEDKYIATLDPAIEIAKQYEKDGVTYKVNDNSDGTQTIVITVPEKDAPKKDPRVTYGKSGRPIANEKGRKIKSANEAVIVDGKEVNYTPVALNVEEEDFLRRFEALKSHGYFPISMNFPYLYMTDEKKSGKKTIREAADVTDQVVVSTKEDGFMGKIDELKKQGYKKIWSGNGSICMAKEKQLEESKTLTEDNYGWQVKPGEELDLYYEMCDAWGEEDVNRQIVESLGTQELGECLEFICRMNDFDSTHFEGHEDDDSDLDDGDLLDEAVGNKLPRDVIFKASEVALDSDDLPDDEVSDILSDKLSDAYGYCHNGFDVEVVKNENGEPSKFICKNIKWDVDKEDDLDESRRTRRDPWGLMK